MRAQERRNKGPTRVSGFPGGDRLPDRQQLWRAARIVSFFLLGVSLVADYRDVTTSWNYFLFAESKDGESGWMGAGDLLGRLRGGGGDGGHRIVKTNLIKAEGVNFRVRQPKNCLPRRFGVGS